MKEAKKHCPVFVILPEGSAAQLTETLSQMDIPYEFLPRARNIKPAHGLFQKLKRHRDKLASDYLLLKHLGKHNLKDSVVHIELAPWHSLLALSLICRKSSQVFITMHNRIVTGSALRCTLWKLKLSAISRFKNFHILASNLDAKESLRSLAPRELVDDIKITYTSVNPPEIDEALRSDLDRDALCEEFGLVANKFTVLCVGQFIDRKGRWIFLEAAKKILESKVLDAASDAASIQFVWISNVKPTAEEEKKIASFGIGNNFHLITNDRIGGGRSGSSRRRDLLQMYRLGDIFVLPSFVEGLPIALLEAMAMEIPAVSTNINGIPEAIIHDETGLLIEPGDAGGLAAAIIRLKNDAQLRKELAASGRRIVLETFDEREAAKTAWESYVSSGSRQGQ